MFSPSSAILALIRSPMVSSGFLMIPCYKIGLAIHLDQHADFALKMNVRGHDAFFRRARGFSASSGDAFCAQDRFCLLKIAAAFDKGALAIHHPRVGLLAELFYQLRI